MYVTEIFSILVQSGVQIVFISLWMNLLDTLGSVCDGGLSADTPNNWLWLLPFWCVSSIFLSDCFQYQLHITSVFCRSHPTNSKWIRNFKSFIYSQAPLPLTFLEHFFFSLIKLGIQLKLISLHSRSISFCINFTDIYCFQNFAS